MMAALLLVQDPLPQAGKSRWRLRLQALRGTFTLAVFLLHMEWGTRSGVLTRLALCLFPPCLDAVFPLYPWLWKVCSANVQVILRDNYSTYSCSFWCFTGGVSLGSLSILTLTISLLWYNLLLLSPISSHSIFSEISLCNCSI